MKKIIVLMILCIVLVIGCSSESPKVEEDIDTSPGGTVSPQTNIQEDQKDNTPVADPPRESIEIKSIGDGIGEYDMELKNKLNVDSTFSIVYSDFNDAGGIFTWYKDNQELQTFESCLPRRADITDFSDINQYFVYTYNPTQDEACDVEVYHKREFSDGILELNSYEGFECGNILIGYIFKEGFNPYQLHAFDTTSSFLQRKVNFATKGREVESCKDFKVTVLEFDEENKRVTLKK